LDGYSLLSVPNKTRLGDTENHPEEAIASYKEFTLGGQTYYFTPGGFLYRKGPGAEEVGNFSVDTSRTKPDVTEQTACRGYFGPRKDRLVQREQGTRVHLA
jgi:hypothetical protein